MTLAELKQNIQTANFGGIKALTNKQLELYQQRAFEYIVEFCEPINLVVSYNDGDIYKILDDGWFLKKPTIAKSDSEYIDIDSRLDMAFVDSIISFISSDPRERIEYEQRAYQKALEYAIVIEKVGYFEAKRIYEFEDFIVGVNYDCESRFYKVDTFIVELILKCILKKECKKDLLHIHNLFLKQYEKYISGVVDPRKREKLQAVDREVYKKLMCDGELVNKYEFEDLKRVTTLFCEFNENQLSIFAKDVDRDTER